MRAPLSTGWYRRVKRNFLPALSPGASCICIAWRTALSSIRPCIEPLPARLYLASIRASSTRSNYNAATNAPASFLRRCDFTPSLASLEFEFNFRNDDEVFDDGSKVKRFLDNEDKRIRRENDIIRCEMLNVKSAKKSWFSNAGMGGGGRGEKEARIFLTVASSRRLRGSYFDSDSWPRFHSC